MIRTIDDVIFSDIADAIREKNGETTTYKPAEMPAAIIAIEGGGGGEGLPDDIRVLTGDCGYKFYSNAWNDLLDKYGSQMSTKDITRSYYMFGASDKLTEIPFEINFEPSTLADLGYMFYNVSRITEIPKLNNCKPKSMNQIFSGCNYIQEYPEDMDTWFDWSYIDNPANNASMSYIFNANWRLRKAPINFLNHGGAKTNYNSSIYYYCFATNYILDEVIGLPVGIYTGTTWTSNAFNSTFSGCNRIKDIIFETQADGTPYVVNWKSQTITLTGNTGWAASVNYMTTQGDLPIEKLVKDDATYQALKNDPDWFTAQVAYSRYNHDSAVNTINSLPDTSAYLASKGGTNTIKFKGTAGENTDGGAINTLTEEEIAVATVKGWTVSFG